MWTLLKIFKSGRSHMVMLTKPQRQQSNGLPFREPELHVRLYTDGLRFHLFVCLVNAKIAMVISLPDSNNIF